MHENIFIVHSWESLLNFFALWKIRNMHKMKNNEVGCEFVKGENFRVDEIERSLHVLCALKKAWKFNFIFALLMKGKLCKGIFTVIYFFII